MKTFRNVPEWLVVPARSTSTRIVGTPPIISDRISHRKGNVGFTLLELLVATAVAAILLALMLPALGQIRRAGVRAKGVSNLRQIGAAMVAYAGEHGNRLPGPAPLGIYPDYNASLASTSRAFGAAVAPYLGLPNAASLKSGEKVTIPALVCPALKEEIDYPLTVPNFVQNAALSATENLRIFGAVGSQNWPEKPPQTLNSVNDYGGPSKVWALTNLDQQLPERLLSGSGWIANLPARPVYVNTRLRLYVDGHVEAVALDAPLTAK